VQASDGSPQKSPPCGQADPGIAVVPTNQVTTYHAGDTITVTVDERVFHPGHYRVALAADPSSLPIEPVVTGDSQWQCASAAIQDSTTAGVIADNMLPHTSAFSAPQSFQVALPAGKTCTNCTLQVIEFMADHDKNNPGGCFYHHCATVSVVAAGTPIPDAGAPPGSSGTGADAGAAPGGASKTSGGCDIGGSGSAVAMALGALGLVMRRRRA
jgi:hypothetical protein